MIKWEEQSCSSHEAIEKVNSNVEDYQFALHQSLPCVKGGGSPQGETEGLRRERQGFASDFGEIVTFYRINPSVSFADSSLV